MNRWLMSVLVALFSFSAFAGPRIKQIDTNKERVAVTATKATTIGSEWMVTTKGKNQCPLEVVDKIGKIAILDASSCDDLKTLKVGQRIQKSLFSKSSGRSKTGLSGKGPAWLKKLKGFSVYGLYSFADDAKVKNNGFTGTADTQTAFGFGAEYSYSLFKLTQGLPISVAPGLSYEFSREVGNGTSKPSFSLMMPYLNGEYDFGEYFSAAAGLNYSIPFEENFGNTKLKSQLGYQLGLTGKFTANLAVDGIYRWINFKATNAGDVSLDGFMLRGRYIF